MNKKPNPVLPYFVAVFCVSALYHWTNLATIIGVYLSNIFPSPVLGDYFSCNLLGVIIIYASSEIAMVR